MAILSIQANRARVKGKNVNFFCRRGGGDGSLIFLKGGEGWDVSYLRVSRNLSYSSEYFYGEKLTFLLLLMASFMFITANLSVY